MSAIADNALAAALLLLPVRLTEAPTQVGPYLVPPGVLVFPNIFTIMNYSGNWQNPEKVSDAW